MAAVKQEKTQGLVSDPLFQELRGLAGISVGSFEVDGAGDFGDAVEHQGAAGEDEQGFEAAEGIAEDDNGEDDADDREGQEDPFCGL